MSDKCGHLYQAEPITVSYDQAPLIDNIHSTQEITGNEYEIDGHPEIASAAARKEEYGSS